MLAPGFTSRVRPYFFLSLDPSPSFSIESGLKSRLLLLPLPRTQLLKRPGSRQLFPMTIIMDTPTQQRDSGCDKDTSNKPRLPKFARWQASALFFSLFCCFLWCSVLHWGPYSISTRLPIVPHWVQILETLSTSLPT